MESEIASKHERVAALEAQLPSAAVVTSALAQARTIEADAKEAEKVFAVRAGALLSKCDDVCDVVRQMALARATHDDFRSKLLSLHQEFALPIDSPPAAEVPVSTIVLLTGTLLIQSLDRVLDAKLVGELRAELDSRNAERHAVSV